MAEIDHLHDDKECSPEEWAKEWESEHGKGFHLNKINGMLQKYMERMVKGRKEVKFLFPFCGKDMCMKWLEDLGHRVIGCDCAPQAFTEFFKEQNLEYSSEKEGNFTVHKSKNGLLSLYCGNFYDFSVDQEGQFDIIWDRGGFNAVNKSEQTKYRDVVVSLMKPDCEYYLLNFDMENQEESEKFGMLTDDKIKGLFDDKNFNLQLREEFVQAEHYNGELMKGTEEMGLIEKLTIITLKK